MLFFKKGKIYFVPITTFPVLGYLGKGITKVVQKVKDTFPTKRRTMDEQFHASYESLATRTLQGDSLDELSTDYRNSVHLDLLTALLDQRPEESYAITERLSPLGKGVARNIVREKHKSLPTEVLKQYFEGDILSAPDIANMVTASLNQGETERADFLYELIKGKVSYDVSVTLRDNVINQYLISPEDRITNAERLLDDVPTETVNGFRDRPMLVKVATAYLHNGEVEGAERIYRRLGDQKALATTVADAYRSVGDNDRAAMLFAEFSK